MRFFHLLFSLFLPGNRLCDVHSSHYRQRASEQKDVPCVAAPGTQNCLDRYAKFGALSRDETVTVFGEKKGLGSRGRGLSGENASRFYRN